MIDLKQLIQAAPFPEDTKAELLEKVDSFSPEKKFELTETCWALISTEYQSRLQYEMQKAMLNSALGTQGESFDLKKIEESFLTELAQKLNASNTKEQIGEVREKLKELTQDPQKS